MTDAVKDKGKKERYEGSGTAFIGNEGTSEGEVSVTTEGTVDGRDMTTYSAG